MDGLVYHNQRSLWEAQPKTDSRFRVLNAQEQKKEQSFTDYTDYWSHPNLILTWRCTVGFKSLLKPSQNASNLHF